MHFSALGAFQLRCWLCMHYPNRGNAYAEVTRPKHAYATVGHTMHSPVRAADPTSGMEASRHYRSWLLYE